MEALWKQVYADLDVTSTAHPVLLAHGLGETWPTKEKMATAMFETFSVPSLCLASHPMLCLYGLGKKSGIVVDSGHDETRAVWIDEGFLLPTSKQSTNVAGEFLSLNLENALKHQPAISDRIPEDVVQDIKERLCYVSLDFQKDDKSSTDSEKSYELPDGNVISLDKERFRAPEALFNPALFDPHSAPQHGIPTIVKNTLMKVDADIRSRLCREIVVVSIFASNQPPHS